MIQEQTSSASYEFGVSSQLIVGFFNRFGVMHNCSINALDAPLSQLNCGDNEVTIYSEFSGHALEVNWPDPVLLVEFATQRQ